MKLFPTRRQWREWRWTTRLFVVGAYVGIILGVLGVIFSVLFWWFPRRGSRNSISVTQSNSPHALSISDNSQVTYVAGDLNVQTAMSPEIEKLIDPKTNENDDVWFKVYNPKTDQMERVEPKEGKLYSTIGRTGCRLEYMVKDGKVFTEYTSPDGKRTAYTVADMQGNVLDCKFPYPLSEYTVVVPTDLELKRSEKQLPNGWRHVHIDLKWNGEAEMLYDPQGNLKSFSCKGGLKTNHKLKRLVVGKIEKTTKYTEPNKPSGGDVQ